MREKERRGNVTILLPHLCFRIAPCSSYRESLCSDPTSNGKAYVYPCHPWIGMLAHTVHQCIYQSAITCINNVKFPLVYESDNIRDSLSWISWCYFEAQVW